MIEIILLVTAALSAGDVVGGSDDGESTAAAQVVTVADETRRGGEERVLALEESARDADEWLRLDDQPLRRLAAGFAPEKDPDLVAPTKVGPDSAPAVQFARSEIRYTSQGNEVRMEVLRPDSDERRPAILILHGASGIGDGSFYRAAAETFAERGYATFLPLYLAPGKASDPGVKSSAKSPAKSSPKTSAKSATKHPTPARDPTPGGSVRAGFAVQERILVDALEQLAQNPYVDASRIGIFGMSLGGFHALNLSSRDPRIAAVVNMGGALRGNAMPDSNRLAPTLALHGAKDSVVPVSRARSLGRYLKEHGIPHDVVIYNDQGHFFRGKARQDAFERSAQFFGSYLTGRATSATARSKDGSDR